MLAALGRNIDFTLAGGALLAFIGAMIIHPTSLCGSGAHPSQVYDLLGWLACLGVFATGVTAFIARKHLGAKIGLCLAALLALPILIITLVVQASPTGLGFRDSDGEHPTMQESLRGLARSQPAGKRQYWLGPEFRKATVTYTTGYRPGGAHYYHWDEADGAIAIAVVTYPGALTSDDESRVDHDRAIVVHTGTGQDVVVTVDQPYHADQALLAAAGAAVQPLPRDVTYSGCD